MTEPSDPAPRPADRMPIPAQWVVLAIGSLLLAGLFTLAHLPAALLVGPMAAGIILGCSGGTIRPPRLPVLASQTVVGCLVAQAITGEAVAAFLKNWPLFLGISLAILATSTLIGWLLTRFKVLPGTTAIWGTAPGGASAMMLMAGDFGADPRLVAFMQYLRVVMVAAAASIVGGLWGASAATPHHVEWLGVADGWHFLFTLLIAGVGGAIGVGLRIPAGALLLPMVIGAVLESTGLVAITLPQLLLAACYTFLGWSIGLGFTRDILRHASRVFPHVLISVLILMGVSGALAYLLVLIAGVDPLTAYLATSPGGIDSVAIIGASTNVDLSFVMAMQTARVVIVLIAGPPLARLIAGRVRPKAGGGP
jgi:uncharacterized protein